MNTYNVEARLAFTKEFRNLCEDVPVAMIRTRSPELEELMKRYLPLLNPPYVGSWFIGVAPNGETLGTYFSSMVMLHKPEEAVKLLREIMKRTVSIEELERRCKEEGSDEDWVALCWRYDEGSFFRKKDMERCVPKLEERISKSNGKNQVREELELLRVRFLRVTAQERFMNAADEFLKRYPNSPHAEQLRKDIKTLEGQKK